MARQAQAAVATVIALLVLSACSTAVGGKAVRASGQPGGSTSAKLTHPPVQARDLLLQDGDVTPLGAATAIPVGDNYFTSARPPDCAAALLFEASPLRPPGASGRAESAYRFSGPALYAESVDVYANTLNTHDVIWGGFSAVAKCRDAAVGVAPAGASPPMRLSYFGTPAQDVLVWTMTQPGWSCDYGLAALPRVALLLSACNAQPGFPMTDWAPKRRAQVDGRTA
jgi:hypothetical protein